MTPEEGFESAQYLVAWANEQFSDLDSQIKAFINGEPCAVVVENDTKTDLRQLKVVFKPIPHRIRGLTNNIVKDLRDALDQATNAAGLLVTGKAKRCRHFPFGESPDDFDVAIARNQCKHIPAALHSVLKSYQPYPTGDGWDGGDSILRLLGRISGPHKHRFTLRAIADLHSLRVDGLVVNSEGGASNWERASIARVTRYWLRPMVALNLRWTQSTPPFL